MPWCEDCSKFWNPTSMTDGGSCPSCGRVLATDTKGVPRINVKELAGEDAKAPWHFKLLVVAMILYLCWRAVQLVVWLL